MNIFVTGRPGIGKSSVVKMAMEKLKNMGYGAGGVFCPEIRKSGVRTGFEIIDLTTNKRGILAHVNQREGPQISRYRVNLHDLAEIGGKAILDAIEKADFIVIDEVGPMELFSEEFRSAIMKAVESPKPVLGVIHWKMQDPLVDLIRSRGDVKIYEVTFENRENLGEKIAAEIVESIRRRN